MNTENKETKIDRAIYDTKLRLNKAQEDNMLILREIKVLQAQLDTLEIIKSNDKLV